jgi:site-specific recombinase XerD
VLVVRQGKGFKDRVVPIGKRALEWLDKYIAEVRPGLAAGLYAKRSNRLKAALQLLANQDE